MLKIIVVFVCLYSTSLWSQQQYTEHTYKLDKDKKPLTVPIEQLSWLVGSWKGKAFGAEFEEVWNPPSAGSMMGMFKLYDKKKGIKFYELMIIEPDEGSLVLKVKHFSADFVSWESKEKYIKFPLVKLEPNAIHFSGLSFYRKSENNISAYLVLSQADGSFKEMPLYYYR